MLNSLFMEMFSKTGALILRTITEAGCITRYCRGESRSDSARHVANLVERNSCSLDRSIPK